MKTEKDELEELLSYRPNKELRIKILEEVAASGKSVEEIADQYSLPPMFIMKSRDPEELIEYAGHKMTLHQFRQKYPHKRIIVIR
jgi:hypothetical protein